MRRSLIVLGRALTIAVVLAWTTAFRSDLIKSNFPFVARAQLRCHRWLSQVAVRRPKVRLVTVVEIDDAAFYGTDFNGEQPVSRHALASLVEKIANRGALVVALDVQFVAPSTGHVSEDDRRFVTSMRT